MYEELIVYVEHIGGGVVTAVMSEVTSQLQGEFCKLAEICKTEKLLSAIVLSVNQEINKTGIRGDRTWLNFTNYKRPGHH